MNIFDYILLLILFSSSQVSTQIHSEYIQIERGIEYYSSNSSLIIDQLNDILTLINCGMKCMTNDQCFSATYYSTLRRCYLFRAGVMSNSITNESAIAITMINRFPSSCSSYITIDDPTRLVTYTSNTTLCDQTLFNSSYTWVRFVSPGGTQIPMFSPGLNHCGTTTTGWINGTLPGIGTSANAFICWTSSNSNNCTSSDAMEIVNCLDYYVYNLQIPHGCPLRFCTI